MKATLERLAAPFRTLSGRKTMMNTHSLTNRRIQWQAAFLLLAAAALPATAFAQAGWFGADGKPLPDSPSSKSRDGFSAVLIVTSDKEWLKKWDTPPETKPAFSTTDSVENGGELNILTFLAGAGIDAEAKTDVTCDLKALRPDGSAAIDQKGIPCLRTTLKGGGQDVYLSAAQVKFVAEPSDQRGLWRVFVVARDNHRGVTLELENSFTVR
jgi:hypothetical protein